MAETPRSDPQRWAIARDVAPALVRVVDRWPRLKDESYPDWVARTAFAIADALLAERAKGSR